MKRDIQVVLVCCVCGGGRGVEIGFIERRIAFRACEAIQRREAEGFKDHFHTHTKGNEKS
jgi:hypothetical protein